MYEHGQYDRWIIEEEGRIMKEEREWGEEIFFLNVVPTHYVQMLQ